MKRTIVVWFASLFLILNMVMIPTAQAQPLAVKFSLPGFSQLQLTPEQKTMLMELEDELIPQFESILTSEQRDQFIESVSDGKSFRKAFKSLTLSPTQKSQLASLFKALPQQEIFAALTPEQKKDFFMKKKEMFMPTTEEIQAKIDAGLKKKEAFSPETSEFAPSTEEIKERINAGLKQKEAFKPSLEEIQEKIAEKMAAMKEAVQGEE
jgi:Spy/CpxP family protein refolding chaperone